MGVFLCKWLMVFWVPVFFFMAPGETGSTGSGGEFHPFHVAVTEINHNAAEKTLEISCKIFTDDFEDALTKKFKTKVDLVHPTDKAAMDKLLNAYILEHLQLKADGKAVVLNYIGFEVESEAVFIYLQGNDIAVVKKLEAVNTILHDMFNDQTEIMHVSVGGSRKSIKIDYPASQAVFQY